MEKEKHDVGEYSYSSWSKIGVSILVSALASVVGFISALVFTQTIVFSGVAISRPPPTAIMIMVVAILMTVLFTFLLSRRERGPNLTKLKDNLTSAYVNALEQSTLNPAKGAR